MPFDWEKYFELGQQLGNAGLTEEFHRAAISRLYYSAFNLTFRYLDSRGKFIDSGLNKKHADTIYSMRIAGHPAKSQILKDLRGYRNECDYDDDVPDLSGKLKDTLVYSKALIDWLKTNPKLR